ncbi:MAG: carboxypeptidase-like regulatory domain-containing protein, partial [Candidatus Solibacter sp.]|nr:carboxypeptidase-like regulatory domain-containing protein [Candidatus Solibacter sp.]
MLTYLRNALLVSTLLAALSCVPAFSQMTVTGTVSGTVTDPSGQVVPAAKVTITSATTRESRTTTSNETGAFILVAVQPDTYVMKVEHAGFKAAERTGLAVGANQRLALGDIQLAVGSVSDTVTVSAQGAQVATNSSEQSSTVTVSQVQNLTARGRDFVSLLRTIPGVGYAADSDSVGGQYGSGTPAVMGGTSNSMSMLAVYGITSNDM